MLPFRTRLVPLLRAAKRRLSPKPSLSLAWHREDPESWLVRNMSAAAINIPERAHHRAIEAVAAQINESGPHPLWAGYEQAYRKDNSIPWSLAAREREPDQVRTQPEVGRLFSWLAERRASSLIVEIGTAFGVSARYWAEGLKAAQTGGRLLTFDPNEKWHSIASRHLRDYDGIVEAKVGTFEDEIASVLKSDEKIDIAFIDAIHTSEFVTPQVEMLIQYLAPGGLILLDDISFSADMSGCWQRWATDTRVMASVAVTNRVGFLEFK